MTQAYPLAWPSGWPRTAATARRAARYHVSMARARDDLLDELRRLGAAYPVLSTDIPVRRDGLPYASAREPDDPGAAVYFMLQGAQHVIACDTWQRVKDNLRAIGLALAALRQLERTGASGLLERAFSGFQALPAPAPEPDWRSVLQMGNDLNDPPAVLLARAERHFRLLAQDAHPDRGGETGAFEGLVRARDAARRELGGPI